MVYPDRVVYDFTLPLEAHKTYIPVDNAWVLANKQNTLNLTSDKSQITADGLDYATVTVQLKTPRLTDDSYNDVVWSGEVTLNDGLEDIAVSLTDGVGTLQVASDAPATIVLVGVSLQSANPLTIEAV
jgi:hypothetical protein